MRGAPHQQRGRHHQLRAARTGPSHARVRSRPPGRPGHRRAVCRRRRDDDHARWQVAGPAWRHAGHWRRQAGLCRRRGHGRGRLGSACRHAPHRARSGVVQAAVGARDQQGPRPPQRGLDAVRARGRPDSGDRGHGPCLRIARADWRRAPHGAVHRRLPCALRPGGRAPGPSAHRGAARHGRARGRGRTHPHGPGLHRHAHRRRLDGDGARMARRPAPRRRPHRGNRPALRLRAPAEYVPRCAAGAGPVRSQDRPGPARTPARAGARIFRGHQLRLHRRPARRALPGRRRAGGPGQSAVGNLCRDAPQPAARAAGRSQPQPPSRTA